MGDHCSNYYNPIHAIFIAVMALVGIIGVLLLILIYKLIKLGNEHFRRRQLPGLPNLTISSFRRRIGLSLNSFET
ncbi:MAG: hypothetical protein OEX16_02840 [Hadesarchaea archaeon]|nr:hypothetical protein [Hadesarchaea archaeon]